ncbi:hypothetical protein [Agromyces larvae]|uniref:Uncharacterized protein n=1 Tax=Agromyces larvae TaxID=2929802 RepID=A0ABY4BWM9_9MICO|nr:hypothetical protein [Agromyces larvae]UOE43593.1 hypothetical protein MTO99_15660 [Agromyces larvae]
MAMNGRRMPRLATGGALVILVAACITGCADADRATVASIAEPLASTPVPTSAEQTNALSDEVVTEAEYRDGFTRYRSCMSERGYEVLVTDEDATVISYSVPGKAHDDGTDRTCYQSEFIGIDQRWQLSHPDDTSTAEVLRHCLDARGIDSADTLDGLVAQLEEADIDLAECLADANPS